MDGLLSLQFDRILRSKNAVHCGHIEIVYVSDSPQLYQSHVLNSEKVKTHAIGILKSQFSLVDAAVSQFIQAV